MTPETHALLVESLQKHEGYRRVPYEDSERLVTVGWGHLIHNLTIPDSCITVADLWAYLCDGERHEEWFLYDLQKAIADAERYLDGYQTYPEVVQQVLAEMAYQLGGDGLARFKSMKRFLERKDYQGASEAGLDSKWSRQTPVRALGLMRLLASVTEPTHL